MINKELNKDIIIKYNESLLLNKIDTNNAIIFILLIPDHNIIKIDCYYHTLDKKKIINHFNKYFNLNCYYILSISGDPQKMFTLSDIKFIKNKLKSNFIDILSKKYNWILTGIKKENNINTISELVDNKSISYTFPIQFNNINYQINKNNNEINEINKYPIHPIYDIKKHTFITNNSYIANKFLFIGGNFSNNNNNNSIEIDIINSPNQLDIDNIKKYIAVVLWYEIDEYIEKWNLCIIMQGIPVFSKFYKKGTIQFKNENILLNYLTIIKNNSSIRHNIAYELSKPFWEWNTLEWKIKQNCLKKNLPIVNRSFNIQYISIIFNITELTNILKIFWNQIFNGNKYINIYTTQHLYNDLINIINENYIQIYIIDNINLKTQLFNNINYIIYLNSSAQYTKDYTKNILYNFDILTHTNIIGKGNVKYSFTLDIPLGSLCCKINDNYDNNNTIKTFEYIIKNKKINQEIYSVDPYEFSIVENS